MAFNKLSLVTCLAALLLFSTNAFADSKPKTTTQLKLPKTQIVQPTNSKILGNKQGVTSPTDGLDALVPRIGRASTRQENGRESGEVDGRKFTAVFMGDPRDDNSYVSFLWADAEKSERMSYEEYTDYYSAFTDEEETARANREYRREQEERNEERARKEAEEADAEAKRLADEAEKAEAEAKRLAEEEAAACKKNKEDCKKPTAGDETSVAGDDEPDGKGATSEDTLLSGNGGDTTGGVNQGDEPQSSGEGGAVRLITGPGSQIQDFPGRAAINPEYLKSLNIITESTGGGPIIIQETD
ncbi:MAG: hypothetical protein V7776_12540 [Halopseudomonas aestusnigri]